MNMASTLPQSDEARTESISGESTQKSWRSFWLLLAAVSIPMMIPYVGHLWRLESYRFFPFAFLAIGWLLHARWDRKFRAPNGWASWLAIALGLFCIVVGVILPTKWLCAVGFIAIAGSWLGSIRGPLDKSLVALVLPLLLLIRLPLGYDQLLVISLQSITTSLTSVVLDCLAIPHAISNNVIQLTNRELFVAEACSGIQSVFTMAFVATVLVVACRRPTWLAPVYILISVLLAIAANIARVSMVVIGEAWFEVDLASGWQHEIVGYVALGMGILFMLSFDQLIVGLLHPVDPPLGVEMDSNPLIRGWNYLVGDPSTIENPVSYSSRFASEGKDRHLQAIWNFRWPRRLFVAFATVLTLASISQAINMQSSNLVTRPTEIIFTPPAKIFNDRFDSIRITKHEEMRGNSDPRLGENADIWYCDIDGIEVESQFVLSQPYTGWHELCICYEGGDWLVLNREVRGSLDESTPGQDYEPLAIARFKREGGTYAYLLYSGFDPTGDILVPPARPGRIGTRFRDYLYGGDQFERANVMMLQLFVVVPNKLDSKLLDSLTTDFVKLRSTLLAELAKSDVVDATDTETGE